MTHDIQETHEKMFENIECDVRSLSKKFDSYVPWSNFVWVIGISSIIIGALFSMNITMMSKANMTDVEMAKIQTKLTSIESQIIELKTILKEVK